MDRGIGLFKVATFCPIGWLSVAWFGTAPVALGLALVGVCVALMSLDSSNKHAQELHRLRQKIATLDQNLDSSYQRIVDNMDRLSEDQRRLSNRIDAMRPATDYDDD